MPVGGVAGLSTVVLLGLIAATVANIESNYAEVLSADAILTAGRTLREMEFAGKELSEDERAGVFQEGACSAENAYPVGMCFTDKVERERQAMLQSGKKAADYIESTYKDALTEMDILVSDDSVYEANLDFTQLSIGSCIAPASQSNAKCDLTDKETSKYEQDLTQIIKSTKGVKLKHMIAVLQNRFAVAPVLNKLTALAAGEDLIKMKLSGTSALDTYNNNNKLHHLLIEQLRRTPNVVWSYFGDSEEKIFSGYRKYHSKVILTFGRVSGMEYWDINSNGRPVKKFHTDPTWVLENTDWYQTKSQSGWTGIYHFSSLPSELSDGISAVHKFSSGVLGTDFLLTEFIHSFLDNIKIPRDAIFLIINTEKQLVASNRLQGEFLNGTLTEADTATDPLIAFLSSKLLGLYPAISNPDKYPLQWSEFLSTPEFVDVSFENEKWDVELMSMENPMQGDAALQWTVVYARPYSSRNAFVKNSKDCVSSDGMLSAISGAVLSWRVQHTDFIHDALVTNLERPHLCLRNLALHSELRETPGSVAYLAHMAETCGVSYIHIANTTTNGRSLSGIEVILADPYAVSCVSSNNSDCVDYQLIQYDPNVDPENQVSFGVSKPVNWGWYNNVKSETPINTIANVATPYDMIVSPGRSTVMNNGETIFNVGITLKKIEYSLLEGILPRDTAIYVTDLIGTVIASTTSSVADYITVTEEHFKTTGLKANILDHGVRRTEVTFNDQQLHVDYKRVKWNVEESNDYWILVIVRKAVQTVTDVKVHPENNLGSCVPCQDNKISIARRSRVVKDVSESFDSLLDIAVRSTLLIQQYLLQNITSVDDLPSLLQKQLTRHSGTLFWIAVFDPENSNLMAYKYENKKAIALKTHNVRKERPLWYSKAVFLESMWAQTPSDKWVWSGQEKWEGKEVMSAVRLRGSSKADKMIIVAGFTEDTLTSTFQTVAQDAGFKGFPEAGLHFFGNDDLPLSHKVHGTIPDSLSNPEIVKTEIQKVAPEFFQSVNPWDTPQLTVREIVSDSNIYTIAAYAHGSPSTNRDFKSNKWNHWLFVLAVTRDQTECADSEKCASQLTTMSGTYYRVVVDHVRRFITNTGDEVTGAPDFTAITESYKDALIAGDPNSLIRKYLSTQIKLYPTVGTLAFHFTSETSTHFIAVIRLGGQLLTDTKNHEDNFVFYMCDGDRKCFFSTLSGETSEGDPNVNPSAVTVWSDFKEHLKNSYIVFKTVEGLSASVGITAAGYGQTTGDLSVKLREMDVSRETVIFIYSDSTWQHLLALNKDESNKVFIAAKEELRVNHKNQGNGLVSIQSGSNHYTIDFTTLDGRLLAIVSGDIVGTKTSYGISFRSSLQCAEQGSCEEEVDSLREKDIRSKADFIALRTTRVLDLIKNIAGSIAQVQSREQFILKAESALQSAPTFSSIRYQDKVKGDIVIVQREQIWLRNTTGTYLQLSGGGTVATTSTLDFVKEVIETFITESNVGLKYRVKSSAGSLIEVTTDSEILKKSILHPYGGVILTGYAGGFLVSNSDCPTAVTALYENKSSRRSALVDSEVTIMNGCTVDLRTIWRSGVMFSVGSVELGLHQHSYPTIAADLGCVTWQSCQMSKDRAMLQVMDSVVEYIYFESTFAEIELRRISTLSTSTIVTLGITDLLRTSHYIKWILSGINTASYSGKYFSDNRNEIFAVDCTIDKCDIEGKSSFNLTAIPQHDSYYFTKELLYYRFGDFMAGVELSSLEDPANNVISGDGVSFKVSLQPTSKMQNKFVKNGEIQHQINNNNYDVYTKASSGIVIMASYTAVNTKVDERDTCTLRCKDNLIKFQGLDLVANAISFHINELVSLHQSRLDLLVRQIVNAIMPEPKFDSKSGFEICSFLFSGSSDSKEGTIGWFTGDTFIECIANQVTLGRYHLIVGSLSSKQSWSISRDRREPNTDFKEVTSFNKSYVPSWIGNGETPEDYNKKQSEVFIIKRMPVGWVAMKIVGIWNTTRFDRFGEQLSLMRGSELIFGVRTESSKTVTAEVSIPGDGNWMVGVGLLQPSPNPPPRLGCFTEFDCTCHMHHNNNFKELSSLSQRLVSEVRTDRVLLSRPLLKTDLDYMSSTSVEWMIKWKSDSYSGFISLKDKTYFIECTAISCVTKSVNTISGEIGNIEAIEAKLPLYGNQLNKMLEDLDKNLFGKPNYVFKSDDVYIGISFDLDMRGLAELLKGFPESVELFLVDKPNRKLLANPAEYAHLSDPTAGQISERCAKNYLSYAKYACGVKSKVFSLNVFEFNSRLHYLTTLPKIAAPVTNVFHKGFYFEELYTRMRRIVQENKNSGVVQAVYFVHAEGWTLGCDKFSRKFYIGPPTWRVEYYDADGGRKESDVVTVHQGLFEGRVTDWRTTDEYVLQFGNKLQLSGNTIFKAVYASQRFVGNVAVDFVSLSLTEVLKKLSEEDLQHPSMVIFSPAGGIASYPTLSYAAVEKFSTFSSTQRVQYYSSVSGSYFKTTTDKKVISLPMAMGSSKWSLVLSADVLQEGISPESDCMDNSSCSSLLQETTKTAALSVLTMIVKHLESKKIQIQTSAESFHSDGSDSESHTLDYLAVRIIGLELDMIRATPTSTLQTGWYRTAKGLSQLQCYNNQCIISGTSSVPKSRSELTFTEGWSVSPSWEPITKILSFTPSSKSISMGISLGQIATIIKSAAVPDDWAVFVIEMPNLTEAILRLGSEDLMSKMMKTIGNVITSTSGSGVITNHDEVNGVFAYYAQVFPGLYLGVGSPIPQPIQKPTPDYSSALPGIRFQSERHPILDLVAYYVGINSLVGLYSGNDLVVGDRLYRGDTLYRAPVGWTPVTDRCDIGWSFRKFLSAAPSINNDGLVLGVSSTQGIFCIGISNTTLNLITKGITTGDVVMVVTKTNEIIATNTNGPSATQLQQDAESLGVGIHQKDDGYIIRSDVSPGIYIAYSKLVSSMVGDIKRETAVQQATSAFRDVHNKRFDSGILFSDIFRNQFTDLMKPELSNDFRRSLYKRFIIYKDSVTWFGISYVGTKPSFSGYYKDSNGDIFYWGCLDILLKCPSPLKYGIDVATGDPIESSKSTFSNGVVPDANDITVKVNEKRYAILQSQTHIDKYVLLSGISLRSNSSARVLQNGTLILGNDLPQTLPAETLQEYFDIQVAGGLSYADINSFVITYANDGTGLTAFHVSEKQQQANINFILDMKVGEFYSDDLNPEKFIEALSAAIAGNDFPDALWSVGLSVSAIGVGNTTKVTLHAETQEGWFGNFSLVVDEIKHSSNEATVRDKWKIVVVGSEVTDPPTSSPKNGTTITSPPPTPLPPTQTPRTSTPIPTQTPITNISIEKSASSGVALGLGIVLGAIIIIGIIYVLYKRRHAKKFYPTGDDGGGVLEMDSRVVQPGVPRGGEVCFFLLS